MGYSPTRQPSFNTVHFAVLDTNSSILEAANAHYGDVLAGLHAGGLQGLDGADGALVIVAVHGVDLVAQGLDDVLHGLLSDGAGKLAVLGGDDLEVGVLGKFVLKALLTINGHRGAGGSGDLDHIDLLLGAEALHQLLGALLAFPDEVCADQRGVVHTRLALGVTVDEQNGDAGLFGGSQALILAGSQHNYVRILGDDVLYVGYLLGGITLGVGVNEFDAALFDLGLDGLRLSHTPGVVHFHLGEGYHHLVLTGTSGAGRRAGSGTTARAAAHRGLRGARGAGRHQSRSGQQSK